MNNNFLLESAITNNKVSIENDDIVIDELFQLLESTVSEDNYIKITIFTPLNYVNTDEIQSHNSIIGKYFYNKDGQVVRFMLDEKKVVNIYEKHDNLRRVIYRTR